MSTHSPKRDEDGCSTMKMRELERLTGVNRETIRVYLREGLLREPARPKPNVAEYDESHVEGIRAIVDLSNNRRLTLRQIKRLLEGDSGVLPTDPGAYPHLDALVAARSGIDDSLIPVKNVEERNPRAMADARALASVGAVRLRRQEGLWMLSPIDAQIVGLWGDMRDAGFTEQLGFDPSITQFYVNAAQALASEEVEKFLETLDDRVNVEKAATLAKNALDLMLPFFGLLRTKFVITEFAKADIGPLSQ